MFAQGEEGKLKRLVAALFQNVNAATIEFEFGGTTALWIRDLELGGQSYDVSSSWDAFWGQMDRFPERQIFLGDFDGADEAAGLIRDVLSDAKRWKSQTETSFSLMFHAPFEAVRSHWFCVVHLNHPVLLKPLRP